MQRSEKDEIKHKGFPGIADWIFCYCIIDICSGRDDREDTCIRVLIVRSNPDCLPDLFNCPYKGGKRQVVYIQPALSIKGAGYSFF